MFKILGNDGNEYGPVAADTVRQWLREGRANAQTLVQSGDGRWLALGSLPEFAPQFVGATPASSFASTQPQNHPLAIIGFILSLISVSLGLCCCYGLPFNLVGITLSAVGLSQIRRQPARYSGRGLALAGLILGIVSLLLGAALLILGVALSWEDIQRDLQNL